MRGINTVKNIPIFTSAPYSFRRGHHEGHQLSGNEEDNLLDRNPIIYIELNNRKWMFSLHWIVEENFKVKIGGNTFINTPNIIMYGEEPLFKIYRSTSDGLLGIDFDIYKENGEKVATIRRSMIVDGNENDFSILKEFDHYTITENSSGRIICDIKKREVAGDVELEVNVQMYTKTGFLFKATPMGINIESTSITGNILRDCKYGIYIDPNGR